ncbi:uncharacterized protein PHACADRAFT_260204 [Phanerochaete carnosa HHB-10118-sp]|uniref:Uncharacterized protein n=1 Tax=Phanerochaete carnosa (strain HHB-10118-sp) TaxID=650164 RepID=K5UUM5_PHACS|nr:uncharacterized protein PHACADRAFT_260204 [Phanerochaete carnosa HHB-10118-sp]EKM53716.1 hypothetical protein PHACADRAFT_260204 [Phanerochaete carnosa HHB-10118-sp]
MDTQVSLASVTAACGELTRARYLTDVLDYLLPIVSPSLLSMQNDAQSTPLHWAALNQHLNVAQKLVEFPGGPGVGLIDIKNAAGRSPFGEAENAGWNEGAKWFVEVMDLDDAAKGEEELVPAEDADQIEVEIQDADGQVAKLKISSQQQSKCVP